MYKSWSNTQLWKCKRYSKEFYANQFNWKSGKGKIEKVITWFGKEKTTRGDWKKNSLRTWLREEENDWSDEKANERFQNSSRDGESRRSKKA